MRRVLCLALPLGLMLAGCPDPGPAPAPDAGDGGPHGCTYPFLGDKAAAPELSIVALGPGMTAVPIADGGMVTLAFPPQCGRVIFAGARARNLDPCGVQLDGVIRDETTKQVRLDSRTINLKPTPDGFGASDPTDISTYANIPVCPNQWSKTDLFGTEYELTVTLTDRGGRTVTKSLKVIPACAEPEHEADCLCICQGGYVLGQSCAMGDGGVGDGGDAGDGGS